MKKYEKDLNDQAREAYSQSQSDGQPYRSVRTEMSEETSTRNQVSNVLRELDSYREAIRQAFEEGFGIGKLDGSITAAWERSEARQTESSFAAARIRVGGLFITSAFTTPQRPATGQTPRWATPKGRAYAEAMGLNPDTGAAPDAYSDPVLLRAELVRLRLAYQQWRSFVQFVFLNGGVTGECTDRELQAKASRARDAEVSEAKRYLEPRLQIAEARLYYLSTCFASLIGYDLTDNPDDDDAQLVDRLAALVAKDEGA